MKTSLSPAISALANTCAGDTSRGAFLKTCQVSFLVVPAVCVLRMSWVCTENVMGGYRVQRNWSRFVYHEGSLSGSINAFACTCAAGVIV